MFPNNTVINFLSKQYKISYLIFFIIANNFLSNYLDKLNNRKNQIIHKITKINRTYFTGLDTTKESTKNQLN